MNIVDRYNKIHESPFIVVENPYTHRWSIGFKEDSWDHLTVDSDIADIFNLTTETYVSMAINYFNGEFSDDELTFEHATNAVKYIQYMRGINNTNEGDE